MNGIVYEILSRSDPRGFTEAEQAIDRLTGAQLRFNASANRWQDESGRFVAANRVTAGSANVLASGLRTAALGLAGGAGLTVAMMAASKALDIGRNEMRKAFNVMRYGVADVDALREAVEKLAKVGKGSAFGQNLEDLPSTLERVNEQILSLRRQQGPSLLSGDANVTRLREIGDVIEKVIASEKEQFALMLALNSAGIVIPSDVLFGKPEDLKEKETMLSRLVALNEKLKEQQAEVEGPSLRRIAALQKENAAIEEAVAVKLRLAALGDNLSISNLLGLDPAGVDEVEANVDRIDRLSFKYSAALERMERDFERRTSDAVAHHEQFQASMNAVVTGGFSTLTESVLSGNDSFGGAMGDFLVNAGRATIAAAPINELVDWKKLSILGAPGMIAAGAGMIAVGATLRRQFSKSHASAFGGTSSSSTSASQLFITDRQTADTISANGGFGTFGSVIGGSNTDILPRLTRAIETLERKGISGTLTSERGFIKAVLVDQQNRDRFTEPVFYHGS